MSDHHNLHMVACEFCSQAIPDTHYKWHLRTSHAGAETHGALDRVKVLKGEERAKAAKDWHQTGTAILAGKEEQTAQEPAGPPPSPLDTGLAPAAELETSAQDS